MEQIKKIDIHAHCAPWPEYEPAYKGIGKKKLSPAELFEEYYDRLNIEKGILLPGVSPEASISPLPSNICKYLADKYPERLLWFCNVDPRALSNTRDADLGYLLEHYKSLGAKGVGELTCNMYAYDPMLDNLFGFCAELDLPVLIHSGFDPLSPDLIHCMPDAAARAFDKVPDITMILAHGGAMNEWDDVEKYLVGKKGNIYHMIKNQTMAKRNTLLKRFLQEENYLMA